MFPAGGGGHLFLSNQAFLCHDTWHGLPAAVLRLDGRALGGDALAESWAPVNDDDEPELESSPEKLTPGPLAPACWGILPAVASARLGGSCSLPMFPTPQLVSLRPLVRIAEGCYVCLCNLKWGLLVEAVGGFI